MKRKLVILAAITVTTGTWLEAKYSKAGSEKSFNRVLDKNELVAAMFYRSSDDIDVRQQVKDFKSAGKEERNVAFVSIDLDKNDLADIGDLYQVRKTPYFMLFRNGVAYKSAVLTGEQSLVAIGQFVRTNFNRYLQRIRRRKRERAEENRPSVSFGVGYGSPYYGGYYGGPYYGGYYGYPYYSRPGFSFGVGF
jgi:hypothetical protein